MYRSSEATLYKKKSTEFQDRDLKFVSHKVLHWRICYFKLHFFLSFFFSILFFVCVCVCLVFLPLLSFIHMNLQGSSHPQLGEILPMQLFSCLLMNECKHGHRAPYQSESCNHCYTNVWWEEAIFMIPCSLCLQKIWQSPYLNVKNNNNNVLRCLAFVKLRLTFSISIYMMLLYFVCSALWDVG